MSTEKKQNYKGRQENNKTYFGYTKILNIYYTSFIKLIPAVSILIAIIKTISAIVSCLILTIYISKCRYSFTSIISSLPKTHIFNVLTIGKTFASKSPSQKSFTFRRGKNCSFLILNTCYFLLQIFVKTEK